MSKITIIEKEKQFPEKKFNLYKGFKIQDNQTIIIYKFAPYVKINSCIKGATTYILEQSSEAVLIAVLYMAQYPTLKHQDEKKSHFIIFRDAKNNNKLIWRSVPGAIKNIPDAIVYAEKNYKW